MAWCARSKEGTAACAVAPSVGGSGMAGIQIPLKHCPFGHISVAFRKGEPGVLGELREETFTERLLGNDVDLPYVSSVGYDDEVGVGTARDDAFAPCAVGRELHVVGASHRDCSNRLEGVVSLGIVVL